jgi:hypothetical protein
MAPAFSLTPQDEVLVPKACLETRALHWAWSRGASPQAHWECARHQTIPIDQRYPTNDIILKEDKITYILTDISYLIPHARWFISIRWCDLETQWLGVVPQILGRVRLEPF